MVSRTLDTAFVPIPGHLHGDRTYPNNTRRLSFYSPPVSHGYDPYTLWLNKKTPPTFFAVTRAGVVGI